MTTSDQLVGDPALTSAPGETEAQSRPVVARRQSQFKRVAAKTAIGAALPIGLLVAWQVLDQLGVFPKALIPTPWTVCQTLRTWAVGGGGGGNLFYAGHLVDDLRATLGRVLVGFALASVIGVALGTAIGVSRRTEEAVTPLIRMLSPVPPITWIPVAIVVLGIGEKTNYFLTFLGAVFPVIAASAVAVGGVPRDLLRAGRMMGRSGFGLIASVVFPAALPGVVGGLRLGLGLSWMMAVTSEMLAVHSGLGYTLWNAYNYLDYPAVFAAMIVTGFSGLVTDSLLRLATRGTLRWHTETGVRA